MPIEVGQVERDRDTLVLHQAQDEKDLGPAGCLWLGVSARSTPAGRQVRIRYSIDSPNSQYAFRAVRRSSTAWLRRAGLRLAWANIGRSLLIEWDRALGELHGTLRVNLQVQEISAQGQPTGPTEYRHTMIAIRLE